MQNIKCFKIDGIELYLDQVLAELEFPILFVTDFKYDFRANHDETVLDGHDRMLENIYGG